VTAPGPDASAALVTPWFPIALRLRDRRCLVVGSGAEAEARARALAAAGAAVVRVARFSSADLDGVWLAVLTDRDTAIADEMARECDARRIFFAAVDDPRVGTYSHLALARAGSVVVAIGTNGEAPALARRLREILQALFERAGLARFAERHAELRRATPGPERAAVLGAHVKDVRFEGELLLPEDGTQGKTE
jgi:uroporphyrin-III C-methyltransferase/precorrin-2 dehydrogenase/sirohydrochlorin ferrochelatase